MQKNEEGASHALHLWWWAVGWENGAAKKTRFFMERKMRPDFRQNLTAELPA
jgi:hypothetical protein